MTTVAAKPAAPAVKEERHRLTALEGVAALSLDALSSVAYGPEAAVLPARQLLVMTFGSNRTVADSRATWARCRGVEVERLVSAASAVGQQVNQ